MSKQPLVSIVIPVYNQKPYYLKQCIDSAVAQTYPNVEIVISDNLSHVSNQDIINTASQEYTNIKVVRPCSFLSMVDNFNFGLINSKGDWVCFLSSDDWFMPDFIEKSLNMIHSTSKKVSFSYCKTGFYNQAHERVTHYVKDSCEGYASQYDSLIKFLSGKEGSFCGSIFNKNVIESFDFFDENINFAGDIYAEIFSLKFGGTVFIDESLAVVRIHERAEQVQRISKNIEDINYIYNKVLHDDLIPNIVNGKNYIIDCKENLLDHQLYTLLRYQNSSLLGKSAYHEAKKMLLESYNSKFAKLSLMSSSQYLNKLFFKLYFLYKWIKKLSLS